MCALYKGERLIAGVATPVDGARSIGQIVQSTIPLVDAGLHLLDGSVIEGNGIYSAFVRYISNIDPSFLCTEAEWQTSVANYGVCSKFVYNSTLNTVRLPLTTSDDNGRYLVDAEIDGTSWYRIYNDGWCEQGGVTSSSGSTLFSKPFRDTDYYINTNQPLIGGGYEPTTGITSRSTTSFSVYSASEAGAAGSSWSVTWMACGYISGGLPPEATFRVYEYIVIATNTKTDVEVDIDEIATDLNGKVDKSSLVEAKVVIETYSSGSSWYRIYSDGWCEQGGEAQINSDGQTVTLLKNFIDTNYYIGANGLQAQRYVSCHTKTTSNFKVYAGDDNTFNSSLICWTASGYIS